MTGCTKPENHRLFLLIAVILLLLGCASRIIRLDYAPLYLDEATHIMRAANVATQHEYFAGVIDNKTLHPIVLAVFRPTGPEAPFVGRMLSVFTGMVSLAACVAMVKLLGSRTGGLIAGLVYAFLPMAVFHERQALTDPLVSLFTTMTLLTAIHMARSPRWWHGLVLGVFLAGAYLTKLSSLPYFAIPLIGAALLARSQDKLWKGLLFSATGIGLGAGLSRLVYWIAATNGYIPAQNQATIDRLRLLKLDNLAIRQDLLRDLSSFAGFTRAYLGWFVVVIVLFSVILLIINRRRRAILLLVIPAIVFPAFQLMISTDLYTLPARYFTSMTAPVAALVGVALVEMVGFPLFRKPIWRVIPHFLLAAIVMSGLWFCALLIGDFDRVQLADGDNYLYREGLTAGQAYRAAADDLLKFWQESGEATSLNTLTHGGYFWHISVYLGEGVGEHLWLKPEDESQRARLAEWLFHGEAVYIIRTNYPGDPMPESPHGAILEQVGRYTHGHTSLDVYRVTGAEGELAAAIYTLGAALPESLSGAYSCLAAEIAPSSAERVTVVAPPNHLPMIQSWGVANTVALEMAVWPLDATHAADAVDRVIPETDGTWVEVIQVNPDGIDPERWISRMLLTRLYRIGQGWFDQISRTTYVTGPTDLNYESINAEWESVIMLQQVALVAPTPRMGEAIRMALIWQVCEPVMDSFVVFTHVVDSSGDLVAQYDYVPGEGVIPMNGWEPDQDVEERIAILLPAGLLPGSYEIRIGLYFPPEGPRLRVTAGGVASDYVVAGIVTIEP